MRKLYARVRKRADLGVLALALLAWLAGALLPSPPLSPYVLEELRLPAHGGRVMLAATVLRPRGDGPFGIVVLNHGVPLSAAARERESAALLLDTAAVFAQRGYAVMMPLRRGFGATGGRFAENAGACAHPNYARAERAAASDVLAAYAYARKLPYADPDRVILAGQSAGAVTSLYAAAQRPPGLRAVLAFAAGRGGDPLAHPGVPCAAEALALLFEDLGKKVEVPVLLHYAENDLFFGPAASQAWFARFKAGGARAEYVLQKPFGGNGHYMFSDSAALELWLPKVERFLRQHRVDFDLRRT